MEEEQQFVDQEAMDAVDNTETADYIEKLNTGGANLGLPPGSKDKINNYLIALRRNYADARTAINGLEQESEEYQEHLNTMNGVNRAVQTLASQVEAYKKNQVGYIQDFDNNALSKSDNIDGKASTISKLYRGALDMDIDADGTLKFGAEGKFVPFSAIANHSIKDFSSANKILKLTNDIYNTKTPLRPERKALITNQVKDIVQQGGRSAVLSLIHDQLIPGFDKVTIPKELYEPKNYPQLEKFFLDRVGTGIEAAAMEGYNDKLSQETGKRERSLDYKELERQARYEFNKSHGIGQAGKAGGTSGSGVGSAGEAWNVLEKNPGKKIKIGKVTFVSGSEKDDKGRHVIKIDGNTSRVSYNTFKKYSESLIK
jgi:hypothetical protein